MSEASKVWPCEHIKFITPPLGVSKSWIISGLFFLYPKDRWSVPKHWNQCPICGAKRPRKTKRIARVS